MGEQFEGSTGGKTWLAAILCGPLAGVVVLLVLGLLSAAITVASGGLPSFPPIALFYGGLLGAVIGWPAMLVFGVPTHVILYRRRSRKAGGYLLGGAICGIVMGVIIFGLTRPITQPGMLNIGPLAVVFLLGAVLASWLFWLIRRPDKDMPRPDKVAAMFE